IPDSAVEDPESWAGQGVPAEEQVADGADPLPDLQADSPLAEMPLIDIPWPEDADLPQLAPLEPETGVEFAAPEEDVGPAVVLAGVDVRISDELVLGFPADDALFPERDAFVDRFRDLSTIEELDDEGNVGRLVAQANADQALLERLLRIYGYYDGQVFRSVGGAADAAAQDASAQAPAADAAGPAAPPPETAPRQANVRFDIEPGRQYRFGLIDLGDLPLAVADFTQLRAAFGPDSGEPLLSDAIVQGRYDLDLALGESGYPFAKIGDPDLLVDHARGEGDLEMMVRPGGKYNFGRVTSSLPQFLSADHLEDIARFEPGDLYQRSLELDLRRAILATGLVASAQVTPVQVTPPTDGQPGTVDVAVELTPAKLRTIAGSVGYGTGEGFKVQGSWEHRNLLPPEGALRVRGILGTSEQLLGATLTKNNFHGRDRILTLDAFFSTIDYQSYDARTVSLIGRFERVSTLLFQKPFTYGAGLELVATQESEVKSGTKTGPRQTFFIAALPMQAQIDTSNNLLDPTRGFRLGTRLSPEISRVNGSNSTYLKVQFDLSYYRPVTDSVVLAGRARVGTIVGAGVTEIAPSRRFYAGGGGSVRGYGYKAIGERNTLGEPNGGRSLVELSAEARIRTGLMDGAVSVVPFVDAGVVDTGPTPGLSDIRIGAGVGVRYHTPFGPLRLDVGVPLNPGPDDARFGVYVALGQAF
ncbi:MAG: BamA/TamA family outer membrane protein, partial [Croceibacterium sp.]